LLDKYLPDRLVEHDHETRKKYLKDRENYLREITNEVVDKMQNQLDAVDTHEQRMVMFSEVLQELLRERIMAIYGRNRVRRQLEEHEKIELDRAYGSYKAMGGNSYIDDYYSRMGTWRVIPDDEH
jgi:sugar-specific transcriptional regulator TrmB